MNSSRRTQPRLTRILLLLALGASAAARASEADHREFEATLHVPYRAAEAPGESGREARSFHLEFSYPHVDQAQSVYWQLELVGPNGDVVQRWHGVEALFKDKVRVQVDWSGRSGRAALADGVYRVRMRAVSLDAAAGPRGGQELAVQQALATQDAEVHEQEWDLAVGPAAAPAMPRFNALPTNPARRAPPAGTAAGNAAGNADTGTGAVDNIAAGATASQDDGQPPADAAAARDGVNATLPVRVRQGAAPATASLPYTVYFGNLHSQTNHSDGGGAVASCSGSQAPQSAAFGPSDAYAYAKGRGLDFLLTSEHNHMYDGSDSTNASADPAAAKALYQSGLSAASGYNAANPGFLGIYGLE